MSIAVSTTDVESTAARLAHAEARRREHLITAGVAIDRAIAELRADPARRDRMTPDARTEYICDAMRDAVRAQTRAARAIGGEQVP